MIGEVLSYKVTFKQRTEQKILKISGIRTFYMLTATVQGPRRILYLTSPLICSEASLVAQYEQGGW